MKRHIRETAIIPSVLALGLSSGCVFGYVRDATNGAPIASATVWTIGTCTGDKCASPADGLALTDSTGVFVFNPYDTPATQVGPAANHEAMLVLYMKTGFKTVSHFFSPKLVEQEDEDGQRYSQVPDQHLTPNAQKVDSDGDGLPNAEEQVLGTNVNDPDTDGDSLSDYVEVHGGNFVDLASLGADPLVPDVFVEMDYFPFTTSGGVTLNGPWPEAVDDVVAAFAAEGINLHLMVDDQIAPNPMDPPDYLCTPGVGPWVEFDTIKAANFNVDRQPFFHYALFTGNYCNASGFTSSSGLSPGGVHTDFIVTLKSKISDDPDPVSYPMGAADPKYITDYAEWRRKVRFWQAGTIMHELGHNLGLGHSGASSNPTVNPTYLSVMTYRYQASGVRRDGENVVDYSQFPIQVNENSLNEIQGVAAAPNAAYTAQLARYTLRYDDSPLGDETWQDDWAAACLSSLGKVIGKRAAANVDWNQDCNLAPAPISLEISKNAVLQNLSTWRDWDNLDYGGAGVIGSSFAPPSDGPDDILGLNAGPGRSSARAGDDLRAAGSKQTIRRREAPEGTMRQEWDSFIARLPPVQRQWLEYTADRPRGVYGPGTDCE